MGRWVGGRQPVGLSAYIPRPANAKLHQANTKRTPSERLYPGGKVAGVPAVKLAPTETLPSGPLSAFLHCGGSGRQLGEVVASVLRVLGCG